VEEKKVEEFVVYEDDDDDDILLIEDDVKIDDMVEEPVKDLREILKKKPLDDLRDKIKKKVGDVIKKAPTIITIKTTPKKPDEVAKIDNMPMPVPLKPEPEITYVHKARLVQLKKPSASSMTSKVTTVVLEIQDGRHSGKIITASSSSMFMWGYNLGKANLMSVIKFGDECHLSYKTQPKAAFDNNNEDEVLVVRKVWFGPRVEKPIRPVSDHSFSVYLSLRGTDETGFMRWIYDQLPPKQYFPFVSDIYEGQVTAFIRDPGTNKVNGVHLSNLSKVMKANLDGGLDRIINNGTTQLIKPEVSSNKPNQMMVEDEPAPPGIEDDEDINEVTDVKMDMNPPENKDEWSALHYLQNSCTKKEGFVVTNKVVQFTKQDNKEFPISTLTNVQADDRHKVNSPWIRNGPFYTLGCLAYFMKCRGLKYGAYVKRTVGLGHDQYVKRRDHINIIDYLTGKGLIAPPNVRKVSDIKEREADKMFFKDRKVEEDFEIRNDEAENSIKGAVAFDTDFYVGGVSLGRSDLRMVLRIGELVRVQLHEMSSAEKRRIKKVINDKPDLAKADHMASLAYVGCEKRPKTATLAINMCPEVNPFMAARGWSTEEFEYMRLYGLGPVVEKSAPGLSEYSADGSVVSTAARLAKEAMQIESPDSDKVDKLLTEKEDVQTAIFLSKIFTQALLKKMQSNLKSKLQDHFATPQFILDLVSQGNKINAAATSLAHTTKGEVKPKTKPKEIEPAEEKMDLASMADKLKSVEQNMANEVASKQASIKESAKKSKTPIRDGKKMLQSYKATVRVDINEGLPSNKDDWTPLEYLRHFTMKKKKVTMDQKYVYFGKITFPRSTRVNFRAEHGPANEFGEMPYYTIEALHTCFLSRGMKHSKYFETMKGKDITKDNHDMIYSFLSITRNMFFSDGLLRIC
jgi:hypothetical protein